MALPTLEKSYEFDVNKAVANGSSGYSDYRFCTLAVKDAWKAWPTNPMTVWGSSDYTANWSNTGDDYWVARASLVNGSPGSWIVMNMAVGGQVYMAQGSVNDQLYMAYSPGGLYTGGGLTTPPTASDAQTWYNNVDVWADAGDVAFTAKMHFIHSTDGDTELVFLTIGGVLKTSWIFTRLQDPVTNWVDQHVSYCYSITAGNYLNNARLGQSYDAWRFRDPGGIWRDGAASTANLIRSAVTEHTALSTVAWTGDAPMVSMGFASIIAGARGRHGRIADLFYIHDALGNGDTLEAVPASPTFEWAVFESLAIPWNGTIPVFA